MDGFQGAAEAPPLPQGRRHGSGERGEAGDRDMDMDELVRRIQEPRV